MKHIFTFVLIALLSFDLHADSYDECILEHMKSITSDVAAEEIRKSCRNKYQSEWEYVNTMRFTSSATKDNDHRVYQSQYCDHASPDGKYCADEVSIDGYVRDNAEYEYRFQPIGATCPIVISSGPQQGWMKVLSCSLSTDRKSFQARVMGWTLPQTFTAELKVERRRK